MAKLSGGERRRLYLLTVLMSNPQLLDSRRANERSRHHDAERVGRLSEIFPRLPDHRVARPFLHGQSGGSGVRFRGRRRGERLPGNYTQYKNKKEEEELLRKQEEKKIPVAPKPVREKRESP